MQILLYLKFAAVMICLYLVNYGHLPEGSLCAQIKVYFVEINGM